MESLGTIHASIWPCECASQDLGNSALNMEPRIREGLQDNVFQPVRAKLFFSFRSAIAAAPSLEVLRQTAFDHGTVW